MNFSLFDLCKQTIMHDFLKKRIFTLFFLNLVKNGKILFSLLIYKNKKERKDCEREDSLK